MALKATKLIRDAVLKVHTGQYSRALNTAVKALERAQVGRQPNLITRAQKMVDALVLLVASGSATEVLDLSRVERKPCQCCGAKTGADGRRIHRNCLLVSARQFERRSGFKAKPFEGVAVLPTQLGLVFDPVDPAEDALINHEVMAGRF
jgi:hypothetical protein